MRRDNRRRRKSVKSLGEIIISKNTISFNKREKKQNKTTQTT